jgi:hypothetical protein
MESIKIDHLTKMWSYAVFFGLVGAFLHRIAIVPAMFVGILFAIYRILKEKKD